MSPVAKAKLFHASAVVAATLIACAAARADTAKSYPAPNADASYPVPPSPYGQVGDPFVRTLQWPGKNQPQTAPAQPAAPPAATKPSAAKIASVPTAPPQQTPSLQAYPDPGMADDPDLTPPAAAPAPRPVVAAPKPQPPVQTAAAKPTPPAPVKAPPMPTPAPKPEQPQYDANAATDMYDSGFQVPSNSPYAARIAAARAAAAQQQAQVVAMQPVSAPPADATPQKPDLNAKTAPAKASATAATSHTTTVPAPSASLASQETDHVFIPGEHYTDASEAPRFYSLHREYGYKPDPITVDDNATGALLTVTPDGGKDANTDTPDDNSTAANGQKATD
ncbi:MAG: hypothetical protein ACTHLA_12270 [Asticcacaulis sp.]|uniref:hypothetical protein n=1 Tax=Asticcacaulis sp. TaxID=1872648 RepID=UPI003F7BF018